MNVLQGMTGKPALSPDAAARQKAEQTAEQFEALFIRQMVQGLRQSSVVGEEGGMFGSGPGASTYTDWFDQNVATSITSSKRLGIKERIISDLERWGQLKPDAMQKLDRQAHRAAVAGDRAGLIAAGSVKGGIDVTK